MLLLLLLLVVVAVAAAIGLQNARSLQRSRRLIECQWRVYHYFVIFLIGVLAMTSSACSDAMTLTLDALMAMTSVVNGQDIVQLASRHVFLSHVKRQPSVRDVFFPTSSRQPLSDNWSPEVAAVLQNDVTWFDFSRYSVLYVAQAICNLRDEFLVHTMLQEDIVTEQLKMMHESSDWKKIG